MSKSESKPKAVIRKDSPEPRGRRGGWLRLFVVAGLIVAAGVAGWRWSSQPAAGDAPSATPSRLTPDAPRTTRHASVTRKSDDVGPSRTESDETVSGITNAINGVAMLQAGQTLAEAIAWARQLPEAAQRNRELQNIAYEAARTDWFSALDLAVDLPAGQDRDDLITHTARQWAAKAPAAAADWAAQIADPVLRERLISDIATAWAESDPSAAAAWAMKSLTPGKPQDDALVSVAQRWTQQQPEAAAVWVTEFPAGTLRDTALEEVVKLWTDQNIEAAGKWLGALGLGSVRDVAVGAYVTRIAPQFPAVAARWAKDIQDESLRVRELETVGESWLASNPAAARTWITQSALPEPAKTRLLAAGN